MFALERLSVNLVQTTRSNRCLLRDDTKDINTPYVQNAEFVVLTLEVRTLFSYWALAG